MPFLLERKKIEKVEKLAVDLHNKTEYVIHKRNLKEALNNRLVFKKVHRVIKFNQNSWLKPYTDMNRPPCMQRRSDVTIRSNIGWDVADNAETSSGRRNR